MDGGHLHQKEISMKTTTQKQDHCDSMKLYCDAAAAADDDDDGYADVDDERDGDGAYWMMNVTADDQ